MWVPYDFIIQRYSETNSLFTPLHDHLYTGNTVDICMGFKLFLYIILSILSYLT